jgi:nicotinamidase-related amidase
LFVAFDLDLWQTQIEVSAIDQLVRAAPYALERSAMNQLDSIDAEHAALLIMHYQNDVFSILENDIPADLLSRTNSLIAKWRDTRRPVVFANFMIDYNEITEKNQLVRTVSQSGYFKNPTTVDGLDVVAGDWQYACPRANVFYGTSLHHDLQAQGIDTLVMAGIASSGVLFSTVGWASDADYRMFIVRDICFDPDADAHEALFRTSFATRAVIV